jgi:cobalt-zinc-cadmium efflux system protein
VFGAIRLLKDAVLVLLEAAPPHLPVAAVRSVVGATAGVEEVHDLHVWSLGAGHDAITVHVHGRADVPDLARTVEREIRASFPVEYVAVQVEHGVDVCEAPGDVLAPRET